MLLGHLDSHMVFFVFGEKVDSTYCLFRCVQPSGLGHVIVRPLGARNLLDDQLSQGGPGQTTCVVGLLKLVLLVNSSQSDAACRPLARPSGVAFAATARRWGVARAPLGGALGHLSEDTLEQVRPE